MMSARSGLRPGTCRRRSGGKAVRQPSNTTPTAGAPRWVTSCGPPPRAAPTSATEPQAAGMPHGRLREPAHRVSPRAVRYWTVNSLLGGVVTWAIEQVTGVEILWMTDTWANRFLIALNICWSMLPFAMLIIVGITFYLVGTMLRSIQHEKETKMRLWKNFGLSLGFCVLFLGSWAGHGVAEWQVFTVRVDGSDLRQVTRTGNNEFPNWSK